MSARQSRPQRDPSDPLTGLLTAAAATVLACLALVGLWRVFGASTAPRPRLRVGVVSSIEDAPLELACAHGVLDSTHVMVVEFASAEDLQNAFLDGNVHAGVFTLDDALRLRSSGQAARVIRCVALSRRPLPLAARPGIASVAALRGRSIGLESGRRTMAGLRAVLARAGLSLADVRLRQVDSESARGLLARGQIDAAFVPGADAGEFGEVARVLDRWTPEAPGDLEVLAASERATQLAPTTLDQLARAWVVGTEWVRAADPATLALLARREALTPGALAATMAPVRFLSAAEDRRLRSPAGRAQLDAHVAVVARRWRELGVAGAPPPVERWLGYAAAERP